MDLQYHDLRPAKSLFARRRARAPDHRRRGEAAITEPPPDTRAYFRGTCLQRWAETIVAANWDSLVFDVGGDPLRRVPMMEPLGGPPPTWTSSLDACSTPAELLERLGA